MEWYWWVIIGVSVLVVAVVLFMLLSGGEEEEAAEEAAEVQITDLNDPKVLKALTEDGLTTQVGVVTNLMISDDGAKGFSWVINEEGCKDVIDIKVLDGKPGAKKEEPAEKEEKADEKAEEGDKKELRDGHEEKGDAKEGDKKEEAAEKPTTYMSVTGAGEGECTFQMAWAESWDADWAEEKTWPEDVKVVQFAVTVEAAEGEKKEGDEKEEKADEKAE